MSEVCLTDAYRSFSLEVIPFVLLLRLEAEGSFISGKEIHVADDIE